MRHSKPVIRLTPAMRRGLKAAIRAAGSHLKLAQQLGVTRPAIYRWKWVPIGRVPEVERLTGVPREVLRPDIYEERA